MKSALLPQIVVIFVFLNVTTAIEAFDLEHRTIHHHHHRNHPHSDILPTNNNMSFSQRRTNPIQKDQMSSLLSPTTRFPPKGGATSSSSLNMLPTIFNNAPFAQSSNILLLSNLVGFLISLATGSHLHLDLIGTGAFSLAAIPSLLSSDVLRVRLSAGAVCVWGAKLAGFLFFRALKLSHDTRLDETLATVGGTAGFWIASALWGIVCSLPHALGTTSSDPGNPVVLAAGMTLFSLGLVTETLADVQKWSFKQANPGKFCDVGLWSVSQRPNYFGNLLLWGGILLMNAPSLIQDPTLGGVGGLEGGGGIVARVWGARRAVAAFLSPLFMWWLFSSQANGSVTNAIELAAAKYGDDPNYRKYLETVPKIVPGLFAWLGQLLPWRA